MIGKLFDTLLLAVLLLVLWCGWMLTLTTSGLKLELAVLAKMLPGSLTVQQAEGSLFGGFRLQQVTYDAPEWGVHANTEALTLTWQGSASHLDSKISVKLNDIQRFSTSIKGNLQATAQLAGRLLSPRLQGRITTSDLEIGGQPLGPLAADISLGLRQDFRLNGHAHLVTLLEQMPAPVTAWVKHPAGQLTLDMDLRGFVTHPTLTGKGHLSKGGFTLPMTGIRPTQIELDATLDHDWQVAWQGSFVSGEGQGKLRGALKEGIVTLTVEGNRLAAANLAHWDVMV